MDAHKERIGREVDSLAEDLYAVSDFLFENPEIAYDEFKACDHLSLVLKQNGIFRSNRTCFRFARPGY